ncbi:MAG: hypothetical protein Q4A60_09315 [Pasteurellaceae bacterium]|nr:hypothetical protein [Pasteurellaceae bacterium]
MVSGKKALFCLGLMLMGFSSDSFGTDRFLEKFNKEWPWSSKLVFPILVSILDADTAKKVKKVYRDVSESLDRNDCKRYLSNDVVTDNFHEYVLSNPYTDYLDLVTDIERFLGNNLYFSEAVTVFHVCLNKIDKSDLGVSSRNFQKLKMKANEAFEITNKLAHKLAHVKKSDFLDRTELRFYMGKTAYKYKDFAEIYLDIFDK